MENLNKQQIVLLTLLVSFVTSIATGIVTVSLMNQAPPAFTQTVNRVVERTIERAVQTPSQSAATVMTKETVVVNEDDMVVAAVDKTAPSIVRLAAVSSDGTIGSPLALGVMLAKNGVIAADESSVSAEINYAAVFSNGKQYPLRRVYNYDTHNLALFKIRLPDGDTSTFTPVAISDANGLKLGQAIVLIGGRETSTVSAGLVSSLKTAVSAPTQATTTVQAPRPVTEIIPSVDDAEKFGGVLVDLSADVVGFEITRNGSQFIPANYLSDALQAYLSSQQTPATGTSVPAGQ